jgi:His-Xaa-Ser system protein HxsD
MGEPSIVNNLEINKKDNYVMVSVNPQFYNLEVVYSAAYSLMDRAYIIIGGNPQMETLVELRPKEKYDLETLGREFNNELINYAVYIMQTMRNKKEKELIMKKALETNSFVCKPALENPEDLIGKPPVEDPEGIAKPWTEQNRPDPKK